MNLEISPAAGFNRRVSEGDRGVAQDEVVRPRRGHHDDNVASSIAQLTFY
jgi:hypothetical protein